MASYAGANIFGIGVRMRTAVNPRDRQVNSYPGVNGLEVLDGGSRGLVTLVAGTLIGSDESGLGASEQFFLSYFDGSAYLLVDTLGRAWPSVRLESFRPAGRVRRGPDGTCLREYTAEFLHLNP